MSKENPNCYECKYRRDMAGSCHSECVHPATQVPGAIPPIVKLAAMMGAGFPVRIPGIHVKGVAHGIVHGWFNWPMDYDPIWLEACDGFEAREQP